MTNEIHWLDESGTVFLCEHPPEMRKYFEPDGSPRMTSPHEMRKYFEPDGSPRREV